MSDNLFGFDGDEVLHFDLADVYERWADDNPPDDPMSDRPEKLEILEWTSKPAGAFLPDADYVIERVMRFMEDAEVSEELYEEVADANSDADVVAFFQAALDVWGSKCGRYCMTDKVVATHVITWDENNQPLLNGAPMHTKTTGEPT